MTYSRGGRKKSNRRTQKVLTAPLVRGLYSKQSGGGTTPNWTPFGDYTMISLAGRANVSPPDYAEGFPVSQKSTAYYACPDGKGEQAVFLIPTHICIDSDGFLYVLENTTDIPKVIRQISPQGDVTTIVRANIGRSEGTLGPSGSGGMTKVLSMAINPVNDVLYAMSWAYNVIDVVVTGNGKSNSSGWNGGVSVNVTPGGTNSTRIDGPGSSATLYHANVLCVSRDGTRIYAYTSNESCLRMIDVTNRTTYDYSSLYSFSSQKAPFGCVVDTSGNLFYTVISIADEYTQQQIDTNKTQEHCIYKISAIPSGVKSGTASTILLGQNPLPAGLSAPVVFAGSSNTQGYLDDPIGTNARFKRPMGLACDSKNNIYVADMWNNCIRVITPKGAVYTVAGGGTSGRSDTKDLRDLPAATNYGDGPNTNCYFSQPIGITIDSANNLYVLDAGKGTVTNHNGQQNATFCNAFTRIRKLNIIPPPSVPGSFTLVTTDPISATFSWTPGTGLTGFEERGFPASFQFSLQKAGEAAESNIAIDGTAFDKSQMRQTASQFITNNRSQTQQGFYINNLISVPLTPGITYASIKIGAFNNAGVTFSSPLTNIIIPPSYKNYTILKSGVLGTAGFLNGAATSSRYNRPRGLQADVNNIVYVADSHNHCIRRIDSTGASSTFFGTPPTLGSTLSSLNYPNDITFSYGNQWPMYIADAQNNRILRVTSAGVATQFGTSIASPMGITVDSQNNVYAVSSATHCVHLITASATSIFAGVNESSGSTDGAAATAKFNSPWGITYDPKYNYLYVADTINNLIRRITIASPVTVFTLAGVADGGSLRNGLGSVARFNIPTSLTADISGNIYVSDRDNHVIRKVTPAGLVSTFSGAGWAGSEDGNSEPKGYDVTTSTATYNRPNGICTGVGGIIFIAEELNQCIRAVSSYTIPFPPTSISLSGITNNSATITWAGDTGATSYSFTISPSSESIVLPTVAVGTRTATFTGLTESTAYTLKLILTNSSGATFPPAVNCITHIDTSIITLNTPKVTALNLIGTPSKSISASLFWTGLSRVPTISYTLTPTASDGTTGTAITGTMPPNQRSPFSIGGLQESTSYVARITGSIPNVPSPGAAATTQSASSDEVTFTTGIAQTMYIDTIAGVKGVTPSATTATTTATTNLLNTQLNTVRDIVSDGTGNFYIAARTCILKLSPSATATPVYLFDRTQTTPTATAVENPPLGLPGSRLTLFAGSTTAGLPSTTAQTGANIRFTNIAGMVYSPTQNALYVSDIDARVVVRVTTATILSAVVVAGIPSTGGDTNGPFGTNTLGQPKGLALDPDGSLYICNYNYATLRKLSTTGAMSTISEGLSGWGSGTHAHPSSLVRFPDGSLYVACTEDYTIRKLTPDPANPGSFTGSIYAGASRSSGLVDGALLTARFNGPQAITVDSKYNIYVLDGNNYAIRVITGGNVYTLMGGTSGNIDGPLSTAKFMGQPITGGGDSQTGLFCDANDNLYLSDTKNGTIRLITTFPASDVITQSELDYYRTSGAQASSAVAQGVSSALAQSISGARQSSAIAQVASQAVASSAVQQTALAAPVLAKDQIVAAFPPIKTDLTANAAILYSPTSTPSAISTAATTLNSRVIDLQAWLSNLASAVVPIFAIAPLYQDRALQTVIPSPFLTSIGLIKLYDAMRLTTVVINSNGYLVVNPEVPSNRPFVSGTVPASPSGAPFTLISTDVTLTGDLSLPQSSGWISYFDTAARRYFYVNSGLGTSQYDHPFPPVFSSSHEILSDATTSVLPEGWLKLKSTSPSLPYYLDTNSTRTTWVHPAPPPDPSPLTQAVDATLFSSYKKYISTTAPTTGKAFYVNTTTKEAQWNFPDAAFNVGPSTAQKASSSLAQSISGARESSATAQTVSSALAESISGAQASSALAQQISGAEASSALAQSISGARESSATAQTVSSALMQSISGAEASSAVAQRASSALMQSISGAEESSARAQDASSALAQSISGARESSATAQTVSSALAQSISGARESSATAQTVSSALAQSISGAQESSATAQRASSALMQSISGAEESSARAQDASSALAQSISGAEASSATAQVASSALAQSISGARESSATAQTVSSALAQSISGAQASSATAQQASMAVWQQEVDILISNKDQLKNAMLNLQANTVSIINSMYAGSTPAADMSTLQNNLQQFESMRANLINAGAAIFQLNASYQDRSLQTIIPDSTLSSIGVTKVYDALRNAYLYLDSNKNIISNPITPAQRAYVSTTQRGGGKQGKSRKSMVLFYDTSKYAK